MEGELRTCIDCGWTGYKTKLAHCHHCKTIYYKCPECGGATEIKRVYTTLRAR